MKTTPFGEEPIDQLARACAAHQETAAWHELVRRSQPVMACAAYRQARRWGRPDAATVEEIVQTAFVKLATNIQAFQPQETDSFYGFLTTLTTRVAIDHFKSLTRRKRGGRLADETLEEATHLSASPALAPEEEVLLEEIDDFIRKAAQGAAVARDHIIFQLYYRLGMTAAAIASVPALQVGAREVEGILTRLLRQARQHFAGRLQPPLRKAAADVVST